MYTITIVKLSRMHDSEASISSTYKKVFVRLHGEARYDGINSLLNLLQSYEVGHFIFLLIGVGR